MDVMILKNACCLHTTTVPAGLYPDAITYYALETSRKHGLGSGLKIISELAWMLQY